MSDKLNQLIKKDRINKDQQETIRPRNYPYLRLVKKIKMSQMS